MSAPSPLLGAGLNVLSQGINAIVQGGQNRINRQHAEHMYKMQRDDNINLWHMQNAYNHPSEQMARLKAAGLNPNLVYKNGATTEAPPVRNGSPNMAPGIAPRFDVGSVMGTYQDVQMKQASLDNLREQNKLLQQDQWLRAISGQKMIAETEGTTVGTAIARQNLGILAETGMESALLKNKQLAQTIELDLAKNEREIAMNASNLREAAERILNLRATREQSYAERQRIYAHIQNIRNDSYLKELDANLKEKGLTWSDPVYMRALGQILSNKTVQDKTKAAAEGLFEGAKAILPGLGMFK